MQAVIKTHKLNRTYHENHFFILSKGNNAGKPLMTPCPNCFVVLSQCAKEKNLLYWLCYGLWQCRYFEPYLIGSVIPFLRLPELKSIIRNACSRIEIQKDDFERVINSLNELNEYHRNIVKQLHGIDQLKKSLMWKLMQ